MSDILLIFAFVVLIFEEKKGRLEGDIMELALIFKALRHFLTYLPEYEN